MPPRFVRACLCVAWLLPLLPALCVGAVETSRAVAPDARVAAVNGNAITAREFVEALRRARALHDDDAQLRSAALAACVRVAVTLQLAREHGVTTVASDAELRRELAAENARRAAMVAKGGVVYGPRKLSWEQFRATWLDRIERELGRALLARRPPGASAQSAPHEDLRACEAAIEAARAHADVQRDAALLARLDAITPLPAATP